MNIQCQYCKKVFSVPDEYKGNRIKCRFCQKTLIAVPFKKPPIVIPKNLTTKANFITKLWYKSPKAFRVGFLTTLGAISALFVSFYLYRNVLYQARSVSDFEQAKQKLASCDLFTSGFVGEPGILRGRRLVRYKFLPDVNRDYPYLSLWLNQKEELVGISAFWKGNRIGCPADIESEFPVYFYNKAICEGFEALTTFKFDSLKDKDFLQNKNLDKLYNYNFYKNHGKWLISISRKPCSEIGTNSHKFACNLSLKAGNMTEKDYSVYDFVATAQAW